MKARISHLQAIGYAALAFTIAVGTDTCMKLVAYLPPHEIVACMGLFGVLAMLAHGCRKGSIAGLWPKNPYRQTACAMLTLICVVLNAVALEHLPLTLFYVMVFTMPMIMAVLGSLFLKEYLKLGQSLAVIIGFAGVVIAVDPFQDFSRGEWTGYAAALGSAFSGAVMFVWLRRMTQSETIESITFFTALIQAIGCGVFLLWRAELLTPHSLVILLLMGAFYMAANIMAFIALKYTTASNFGQIHYTQIVTGAVVGYAIWHDIPTLHLAVGGAIIIASGLYIADYARKTPYANRGVMTPGT